MLSEDGQKSIVWSCKLYSSFQHANLCNCSHWILVVFVLLYIYILKPLMQKRHQALSRFSLLKAVESWAGPGNEATTSLIHSLNQCGLHITSMSCVYLCNSMLFAHPCPNMVKYLLLFTSCDTSHMRTTHLPCTLQYVFILGIHIVRMTSLRKRPHLPSYFSSILSTFPIYVSWEPDQSYHVKWLLL